MQSKVAKAFNHLRGVCDEVMQQKHFMRGIIRRMLVRKLSAAFEKWQFETITGQEQQTRLRRALRRMVHRLVFAAFQTWRDEVC